MGRMALKLRFAGHAQLWAEIVLSRGDRIFIPTTEVFDIGAQVPLTLECPEISSVLTVATSVVGHRPGTGSTAGGLVVTLSAHSLERVEGALSSLPAEHAAQQRPSSRPERAFNARIVMPHVVEGCSAKSLSATGMTLVSPTPLAVETTIVVALHLPDGDVQLPATVSWARPELSLLGLRLGHLEPSMHGHIKHALEHDESRPAESLMPSGLTIVVADDDPSILDFVSRVVTDAGHRVVRAERGDVALQLIRQERPKLVFLDVLMPGLDGLAVCTAVRNEPALAKTPVVLLSAMGEQRLAETVRDSKANDFLTKPMKIESVRAILSKYL